MEKLIICAFCNCRIGPDDKLAMGNVGELDCYICAHCISAISDEFKATSNVTRTEVYESAIQGCITELAKMLAKYLERNDTEALSFMYRELPQCIRSLRTADIARQM